MIGAHRVVPPAARSSAMRASHAPSSASSRAERTRATSRAAVATRNMSKRPASQPTSTSSSVRSAAGTEVVVDHLQLRATRLVGRVEGAHLAEDATGLELLAFQLGPARGLGDGTRARVALRDGELDRETEDAEHRVGRRGVDAHVAADPRKALAAEALVARFEIGETRADLGELGARRRWRDARAARGREAAAAPRAES